MGILSHRLWKSRYGGDPSILGRGIHVDGESCTVVGVMPPEFDFPLGVDLWLPLLASAPVLEKQPNLRILRAAALLKPGVTPEKAQAEMSLISARLQQLYSKHNRGFGVTVIPMIDAALGKARPALHVLLGAVLLVVLIACANVGNLFLARAAGRQREMAIRAAMGAGRGRLVRQLLTESLLVALAGGVCGLLLARYGVAALTALAPQDIPRIESVSVDLPVVAFALLLSVATALLFGLAPALHAVKFDVQEALKQSRARNSGGRSRARLRGALVVAEVAISALLAIGAGLLVRSFQNLQRIDPGFQPENILTFRVTLNQAKYETQEARRAFYGELLERVGGLPGVESAAAVLLRPLSGAVGWDNDFTAEGQAAEEQALNPHANYEAVSPGYFHTMGIPLLAGRDFGRADTPESQGVVIVNESAARRYWSRDNPVGKRIRLGPYNSANPWLTVIGVVKDVRYREWEAARVDLYIPYTQRAQHRSDFVVKTAMDPLNLVAAIRREVQAIDKDQPVSSVTTMERLVEDALAQPKFNTALLGLFAGCALLLAVIGVYGVVTYTVAERTRDIGIRMALGSSRGGVLRMVLAGGLRLGLTGALLGTAAAFALTRVLSSLLFAVSAADPATYAAAAALLVVVALGACLLPALRAARVNPAAALECE